MKKAKTMDQAIGCSVLEKGKTIQSYNCLPVLEEPAAREPEEQVPDTSAASPSNSNGYENSAGNNGQGNGNNSSNGDGNDSLNKTSMVVKEFAGDYSTGTFEPLMEHEVNGLNYKLRLWQ